MDWLNLGTIVGLLGGASSVLGVVIGFQVRAKAARQEFHDRLDKRFADQAAQTKLDHDAVKLQVQDMADTIASSYIPRREHEVQMASVMSAISGVSSQISAAEQRVSAQVTEVRQRVDQLFQRKA